MKWDIQEFDGISYKDNKVLLKALEGLRSINVQIKDAKEKFARKRKTMDQLRTPSHRLITLNPSSIIEKANLEAPNVEGEGSGAIWVSNNIMLCALCSKVFPMKDVIMASCSCNYHL